MLVTAANERRDVNGNIFEANLCVRNAPYFLVTILNGCGVFVRVFSREKLDTASLQEHTSKTFTDMEIYK